MDWILHFVIVDNIFDLKLLVLSDVQLLEIINWSHFIDAFKSHWPHIG